jgi:hypothetical protein
VYSNKSQFMHVVNLTVLIKSISLRQTLLLYVIFRANLQNRFTLGILDILNQLAHCGTYSTLQYSL